MNEELKAKALEKMLVEMNVKHSPAIDRIHNWLCNQDDDVMMQNILKDGKTITGSFNYAKSKAQKEAENGVACIEDSTVYDWIKEYFASDAIEKPAAAVKEKAAEEPDVADDDQEGEEPVQQEAVKPAKVKKPSKKETEEAEKIAKEKAAADTAEAARKAAHAPINQTSIFDFTE